MFERINDRDGHIRIAKGDQSGTTVIATIPIQRAPVTTAEVT
jgi:signal transduction histidine kinase